MSIWFRFRLQYEPTSSTYEGVFCPVEVFLCFVGWLSRTHSVSYTFIKLEKRAYPEMVVYLLGNNKTEINMSITQYFSAKHSLV
jgi:hypothetical protein